jgi:ribosomal protein S18 acetylase RimI-like enzyme
MGDIGARRWRNMEYKNMSHNLPQGLVKKQQLSSAEIVELQLLVMRCEQYEPLRMRVVWHVLHSHIGSMSWGFFYYQDGDLVGCLTLDSRGGQVCEAFGLVHPAHRRKGIFRQLFQAAVAECRAHDVKQLVLICEQTSASGQAFLRRIGASEHEMTLVKSEYEMTLVKFQPRYRFDERLVIAPATIEDIDALATVQSTSFGKSLDATRRRVMSLLPETSSQYYLATFGEETLGCREPVASLRVEDRGDEIGIYSFGVLPDYRGRGYGRQMLEEVILTVHNSTKAGDETQPRIMLDVHTNNSAAVALYRSCGFQVKTTYDHVVVSIGEK